MIKAQTEVGFDLAMGQLQGHLSKKIHAMREELLVYIAHVVVNIEYPDEDIEEMTYNQLYAEITTLRNKIHSLIDTFENGKMIKEGLSTVIIGKTNVGKSS